MGWGGREGVGGMCAGKDGVGGMCAGREGWGGGMCACREGGGGMCTGREGCGVGGCVRVGEGWGRVIWKCVADFILCSIPEDSNSISERN